MLQLGTDGRKKGDLNVSHYVYCGRSQFEELT